MDIASVISQLKESNNNKEYQYHCCDEVFDSLYEFRRHMYECHKEDYDVIEPYFHREKPVQTSKEERRASVKRAIKRKQLAKKGKRVRERVDYDKQPRAWIIYNHNGLKK